MPLHRLLPLLAAAIAVPLPLAAAPSAQPQVQDLKRLTLEELMQIDVTSVLRRREPRVDAPAAIAVITAEEIRRAGVSTLPDALRLAEGLAVARFDAGTWAISSRGFASTVVNKMLVLIDGRSVYTPLFGGVFWDAQDTLLPDIERIEVIRGPAGTLWGANAVNGVINIITKRAGDTQGGLARVATGTRERAIAALRYGGTMGPVSYRVFARSGYWDSPRRADGAGAHEDRRSHQVGFRADWTAAASTLMLSGDLSYGRRGLFDRPDLDFWGGHLLGRWERRVDARSAVKFQAYIDRSYRHVPDQTWEERTTYDLEAQHEIAAGRHQLVWGGGSRLSKDRTRDTPLVFFTPPRRSLFITNLFVDDEIALRGERLFLTLGSKIEHATYSGWEPQPNVRLRARVTDRTTIWGAVSRAVRTPTRFDRDLNVTVHGAPLIVANESFDSESLVAYETGVRVQTGGRASFELSAFYNRYDDLRSQEPTPPLGVPLVLANKLNANGRGFEIVANVQPASRWLLAFGYAFLDLEKSMDADSRDVSGGVDEANDPRHQFSMWSYLDLGGGFELDGVLRAIGALERPAVPGYAEMDLRFGWRNERRDLSIVGRDLLHGRHPEFGAPGPGRREFQREVAARATFFF